MIDYINIGSTPYDEECAQVGSEDYNVRSRIECAIFKRQCERVLNKKFGDKLSISVGVKAFPHDFGTYREVVAYYNPDSEEEVQQALYLEGADLEKWDKAAIEELKTRSKLQ